MQLLKAGLNTSENRRWTEGAN